MPICSHRLIVTLALSAGAVARAAQPSSVAELADLSLEQLASLTVTSASGREERLLDAPASIFVITAEDIRRAGATSLPEALRLAPNLHVARSDANQYAIAARGGNAGIANKMLVLIDGRTVYTPLFSGVFWDSQVVFLPDIERIEVISGAGGTLWGTNAVNGVINITTKAAGATRGVLAEALAGEDRRGVAARVGASPESSYAWRVYAQRTDRDATRRGNGQDAQDGAQHSMAGARVDSSVAGGEATVEAQFVHAEIGNYIGDRRVDVAILNSHWERALSDGILQARAYVEHSHRDHASRFNELRDTLSLQGQRTWDRDADHHWVLGAEYRSSHDRTRGTPALAFDPASRVLEAASLYAQDEIALASGLRAIVGLRAEYSTYTHLEWLPTARLAWSHGHHLLWSAASRAVRVPSRLDRDPLLPGRPPFTVLGPNPEFGSEKADVLEAGYRGRPLQGVIFSFSAFHHRFRELRSYEPGPIGPMWANGAQGTLRGAETWTDWSITPWWRLAGGATLLREHFETRPGHVDIGGLPSLGNDPRSNVSLRSQWSVASRSDIALAWRRVAALPNPQVPAYAAIDLHAGMHLNAGLDARLSIENVLDRKHPEFDAEGIRSVFGRSAWLRVRWVP